MQFVSIIIPTFNRARLLDSAIRSVLGQSFRDFEVIISDGGSTDNTSDLVRSFGDDRIKYVASERVLTAAENYQQGLDAATGEFVTFLSDDDVYCPDLLEIGLRVLTRTGADIVAYRYARYYEREVYDFNRWITKNSLLVERNGSLITEFEKEQALTQSLVAAGLSSVASDPRFIVPYLSNALYKRTVLEHIRKIRQSVFDFVPPDMYLATAVFFHADKYVCIDEPLLVWRNWDGNYSATASPSAIDFKSQYRQKFQHRTFCYSPLKFPLPATLGAECALYAIKDFDGSFARVDWGKYFFTIYENLLFLQSSGIDVSEELQQFEVELKKQPAEIYDFVTRSRTAFNRQIKQFISKRFPKFADAIRQIIAKRRNAYHLLNGNDDGFENILEAATLISKRRVFNIR